MSAAMAEPAIANAAAVPRRNRCMDQPPLRFAMSEDLPIGPICAARMLHRGGHSGEIVGLIIKGTQGLMELLAASSNARKSGLNALLTARPSDRNLRSSSHIWQRGCPNSTADRCY